MNHYQWDGRFVELFERCAERYRGGDRNHNGYYSDEDLRFLKAIGYKNREFFDFVEDHCDDGEPSATTALMVASVRRDYLRWEMDGRSSRHEITSDELPGRSEALGGVDWLPRIIVKARAKLRGELDPDIMFCCGGDRGFLRHHNIAPADFLRGVWSAENDDSKILEFVKAHSES
ncbi:MAG: DUF5069 domain-containing protein [Verrucomicrobiales bacterium]